MERQLSDRLLLLKIKLALTTEKLVEYGQDNFASYIYTNLAQLYLELEEMDRTSDHQQSAMHLTSVLRFLEEIENILLACKVGIRLPLEESTRQTVKDLKTEMRELLRREEFDRQVVLHY